MGYQKTSAEPIHLGGRLRLQGLQSLAALLGSGIASDQALGIVARDLPAPAAARLSVANAQQPLLARLIAAGLLLPEERPIAEALHAAGRLDGGLAFLAERLEGRLRLLGQIKARLAMPLAVLLLALFIVPLPRLVAGDLGFVGYLWRVLWPVLLLGGVGAMLWRIRGSLDPLVARFNPMTVAGLGWRASLLHELGQLQEAGMDAANALDLLAEAEVPHRQPALQQAASHVRAGVAVADSLLRSDLIDRECDYPLLQSGEQAGRLPQMLCHRAQQLERQQRQRNQMIAEWLPRLFYALVAGFIAYSLIAGTGSQLLSPGQRVPVGDVESPFVLRPHVLFCHHR